MTSIDAGQPIGDALSGHVRGGQQPVSGARIYLYAAGLTGSGPAATDLLAGQVVTTNGSGMFSAGGYTCPASNTQVYLVARGGNPGLSAGTSNAALAMMTALGSCGSLAAQTNVSVNISIDEATTVAAVWALARFMTPGGQVNRSATNATGLQNAFQVAQNLADSGSGLSPGASLPAGAVTETAKLYALSNALAVCVNSDGGGACTPLFSAATIGGVTPGDTLDAALAIVRNPASQVKAVFNSIASGGPFQPSLVNAPSDWTMSVTYGGCATCGGLDGPGNVAIDAGGNVWVPNYAGGVLSKFLPNGLAAAPTGFAGVGLNQSFGVTVDPQDTVWVSSETSVRGANNSTLGSISRFSQSGVELSGFGYTGGGVYYPQGLASDVRGNIWAANYGDSSATLLANDGSAISGPNGYAYSRLPFTPAVAVDASRNAWFAVQQGAAKVTPGGVVTRYACCSYPAGVAIDQNGNVWLADYGGSSLVELNASGGQVLTIASPNASLAAQGIAIDGTGQVWAANFRGNSITAVAGASGTVVSPLGGYGQDAPLDSPRGIAIDAAGNLWMSNYTGNTLTQMVGIAAPVMTPLLGPPSAP